MSGDDSQEMVEGMRVLVLLSGDDTWYTGTVLDRPRKMWVRLDDYPYTDGMIADSSNIVEWHPASSG